MALTIKWFCSRNRNKITNAGVRIPDHFLGFGLSDAKGPATWLTAMKGLKEGIEDVKKLLPIFSKADITEEVSLIGIMTKEMGLTEDQIIGLAKAIGVLNIKVLVIGILVIGYYFEFWIWNFVFQICRWKLVPSSLLRPSLSAPIFCLWENRHLRVPAGPRPLFPESPRPVSS